MPHSTGLRRLMRMVAAMQAGEPVPEPEPLPITIEPNATAAELVDAFVAETEHWEMHRLGTTIPSPRQMAAGRAIMARSVDCQREVLFEALTQAAKPPAVLGGDRPYALVDCAALVLPRDLGLDEAQLRQVLELLIKLSAGYFMGASLFQLLLAQIEKRHRDLSAETADLIWRALEAVKRAATGPEYQKLSARVTELLSPSLAGLPEGKEIWVTKVLDFLRFQDAGSRAAWQHMLAHAMRGESSKPTTKWNKEAATLVERIGRERYKVTLIDWFEAVQAVELPRALSPHNVQLVKGLVWACADYDDAELARALGRLAESMLTWLHYFPVLDWRGLKAGNAALYSLSAMPGDEPIAQLSRLSVRLKGKQLQDSVGKALKAASERRGMSRGELEELSVPAAVDDNAEAAPGTGKARKASEADQTLAVQRTRLERLLLTDRSWSFTDWQARYQQQPLLAPMVERLIWIFDGGSGPSGLGISRGGAILDVSGEVLPLDPAATHVRLWHPIDSDADTVRCWRQFLVERQIVQPFKQAHREVYAAVATGEEAEWNGFAGHIIRQTQFKALCDERGWRYGLQGTFVRGNGRATRLVEDWDLRAELRVEPAGVDGANGANAAFYKFLMTGGLRFSYPDGRPCALRQIPPLVLSELLRDVDLFVGVCSIGTDPGWGRRRTSPFGDYWRSFAFAELSEAAASRREALTDLLPGLSVAPRSSIEGRFLVVQGDLRTYKIHIGSGNVLMSPNDKLLVLPSPKAAEPAEPRVFLPFEGDTLLGQIVSRATVLAGDSRISDAAVRRQIERG